jgi:hypothetical protein
MRVAASHCAVCAQRFFHRSRDRIGAAVSPRLTGASAPGFSDEERRPPQSNDPIVLNIPISTEGEINVAVKWDV